MQKAKYDQIFGHNIGPCKVICVLVESYTKIEVEFSDKYAQRVGK